MGFSGLGCSRWDAGFWALQTEKKNNRLALVRNKSGSNA